MGFDAMSVIDSNLEHREEARVPFSTQEFIEWCRHLEGIGIQQSFALLEANQALNSLADAQEKIESTPNSYCPENNLGWYYCR